VQCIVDRDADIGELIPMVIAGRAFDNGIICAAEQSLIFPAEKEAEIVRALTENRAVVLPRMGEADRKSADAKSVDPSAEMKTDAVSNLREALFTEDGMNRHLVGQSARAVAEAAGLKDTGIVIPDDTLILAVFVRGPGAEDKLSGEKMSPVLSLYPYETFEEAIEIAKANLEYEGKGHSVSIHSHDAAHIEYAGLTLPVSRIIVNQISSTSAGGSNYNGLAPTNTLGCGSWGGNSISENLTYKHLINTSRIAERLPQSRFPDDVF
jgi:succinate-semialdehyde dehydrogenase